jgi:hypothetical protein
MGATDPAELLRRAPASFASVRAAIASSADNALAVEAKSRWLATSEAGRELLEVMRPAAWARLADSLDRERDCPAVSRYWIEPPDRVRVEEEESVTLRVGGEAWSFEPGYYTFRAPLWPLPLFFDAAWLADELTFAPPTPSTIAGRACLVVRAHPNAGPSERLKDGADAYELAIDVERGVLLGFRRFLGGTAFATYETVEIAYDEELPAELWEPPELEPRAPTSHRAVSPGQAAELLGWAPLVPPEGWEYRLEVADDPEPDTVTIRASRSGSSAEIVECGSADPGLTRASRLVDLAIRWKRTRRGGRSWRYVDARHPVVDGEADGVALRLGSDDLSAEELLDLAVSLR